MPGRRKTRRGGKKERKKKKKKARVNPLLLPEALVTYTLHFLAPVDLCRCASVSRSFNTHQASDKVWRPLLHPRFADVKERQTEETDHEVEETGRRASLEGIGIAVLSMSLLPRRLRFRELVEAQCSVCSMPIGSHTVKVPSKPHPRFTKAGNYLVNPSSCPSCGNLCCAHCRCPCTCIKPGCSDPDIRSLIPDIRSFELSMCDNCFGYAHNECFMILYCEMCDMGLCSDCEYVGMCSLCESFTCSTCCNVAYCEVCKSEFCSECRHVIYCDGPCTRAVCSECSFSNFCGHCFKCYCSECSDATMSCYCDKCFASSCYDCGKNSFCKRCEGCFCDKCGHMAKCVICGGFQCPALDKEGNLIDVNCFLHFHSSCCLM